MRFLGPDKLECLKKLEARDISGVIVFGDVHGDVVQYAARNATDLTLPWRSLDTAKSELAWLEWRTRLTDLIGRKTQFDELMAWATDGQGIEARLLYGEGGVGKTRLAAEVADALRDEGWAAGLVNLDKPCAAFTRHAGTLVILDYPEENRSAARALLERLRDIEGPSLIRLLFLSRRGPDFWESDFDQAHAHAYFHPQPIELGPLSDAYAYDLFLAAQQKVPRKGEANPQPVLREAFLRWLAPAPANLRPLFILAAAIHSLRYPDVPIVSISGPEIIDKLGGRELARLRNESKEHGLDVETLTRLIAFAAMRGRLDGPELRRLAEADPELGFPPPDRIVDAVRPTSCWTDSQIAAPKPDIVAASMLIKILGERPDKAPAWLWLGIERDIKGGLEKLARLSRDAEVVLGWREHCISAWLPEAFNNRPERCVQAMKGLGDLTTLPHGLVPLSEVVWRTLHEAADNPQDKAGYLSNLAAVLAEIGRFDEALTATRQSVGAFRELTTSNPATNEPHLAASLNNLSGCLSKTGDAAGALAAIEEAVEIRRRLAEEDSARFEPDLANSLNNLSNALNDVGGAAGVLAAIQEAVEIRRRLAAANPARYEPHLAMSLNSLSNRLSDTGDAAGALAAIQEAVEIRCRLAAANPARFEPDLAMSLNNLSVCLGETGDAAGALAAIQEAVNIRRRLAAANPARFEPDLATSLAVLSNRFEEKGDVQLAVTAMEEAIRLMRPYAERYPESQNDRYYKMMKRDFAHLTGKSE